VDWIVLGQQSKLPVELWITCAILIALVVLLGAVVLLYRRKVLTDSGSSDGAGAWDLDDLHRLKNQGEITEAEYQAMRASIIRAYTGDGDKGSTGRVPATAPAVSLPPSASSEDEDDEDDDVEEWDWVADPDEYDDNSRKTDT